MLLPLLKRVLKHYDHGTQYGVTALWQHAQHAKMCACVCACVCVCADKEKVCQRSKTQGNSRKKTGYSYRVEVTLDGSALSGFLFVSLLNV